MSDTVLKVSDLTVEYPMARGSFFATRDVGFSLQRGERFGLVGESGSGKSTTILALMRMLKGGLVSSGSLELNGRELTTLDDEEYRKLRFAEMSLVPQGAMNSLNPVLRVGAQIADIYDDHGIHHGRSEREGIIGDLLSRVGLAPEVQRRYPHELSGGMKQRVCIAMSIALKPSLILADEPTSALDVMVQKQVLATLGRVQRDIGAAIILIGHDMALMAHFVTTLGVMYRGELIEVGPVREIFANPQHDYTRMLINSLPSFDRQARFIKAGAQEAFN
ncbi:ABC transporter ATP-binding protein [Devosia sp.]|uniref:ABC transporter ATP-binding protein n=1 Tax=Devosia sp. TaxID=1871048 RepID=UPI001A0191A9|nr:ABC transporter ATP-binding protein [Devosia sp.]MBE0581771.1 ABC transporter ATP-binding protein [Devosia sp.]